jgi:hypothetical protein
MESNEQHQITGDEMVVMVDLNNSASADFLIISMVGAFILGIIWLVIANKNSKF